MAVNTWRTVITDIHYTPVGELFNASDRQVNIALNRTDTASLKVRTDNPFAELLYSMDCFLKFYRNDQLVFFGLVTDSDETVSGQEAYVTVQAAGPTWVLPKRFAHKANWPMTLTGHRAQILLNLWAITNAGYVSGGSGTPEINEVRWERSRGETGVGWYSDTSSLGGSITYPVQPYKPFSEVLNELSNAADGFEWRVKPFENWVNGELVKLRPEQYHKHGELILGAPLGTTRPEAIFEFGDGRVNLTGYKRTRSRSTQANVLVHLLNGQPESDPIKASYAQNEEFTPVGIMEDVVQADLTRDALRQDLVDEHRAVRVFPRSVFEWTPMADYGDGRLPQFGIDYDVGDIITGRARTLGKITFNGQFRVWGVRFSVDAAGIETPTIMLQEEAGD